MTNRPAVFIVLIAALLLLTLAPVYGQPAAESPGQADSLSLSDTACQIFAIANSIFHLDRDPHWIDVSFVFKIAFPLPNTLPASLESRGPPA